MAQPFGLPLKPRVYSSVKVLIKEIIASIRLIAESFDEVDKVNELLTMHMGPEFILVNISIRFKRGQLTREIEAVIQDIDSAIKAKHGFVKRIFVEAEPA